MLYLAVNKTESDAMVVGRIAADIVSFVIAVAEVEAGIGIAGGGSVVGCGTTLCLASPAAATAGAAVALQGVGTGVNAAISLGQNVSMLADGDSTSNDTSPINLTFVQLASES